MEGVSSFAGIALILGLAVLLSEDRQAIRPRVVAAALALLAGFAGLVLYVPAGNATLQAVSRGVSGLLGHAKAGGDFLFGPLARPEIGGLSFAIAALPTIVFFATLIGILQHVGLMGWMVRRIGGALQRVTGISRVESLAAAANVFVGQSEAPLAIRPYLAGLNRSQLFCLMTVGLAGVAGTILAAYASMGIRIDYLVAASFMSAPGGIAMAKIVLPDRPGHTAPLGTPVDLPQGERPANWIMAASEGAQTGARLALAVGAMVLAFVALVSLANGMLGWLGGLIGWPALSLQMVLGWPFAGIFRLIGAPDWSQAQAAGALFGTKLVLNEFVAFIDLAQARALSARTVAVVTFALCGFANIASIAIQMAVTGTLAPNQRAEIARLGPKALAAASLANLMSAALAGLCLG